MTLLSTTDMLQLLRFKRNGRLSEMGDYKQAIIGAILVDLLNLKKIAFKIQDENKVILKAIATEPTGDLLLDEVFLTIRDCPKTYTLVQWFNRLNDCYDAYEEIHLKSLIQKEIIAKESGLKTFGKYFLFIFLTLIIPVFFLGVLYYYFYIRPDCLIIKNPKLVDQIKDDLHNTLTTLEMPEEAMLGLISILAATGLYRHIIDTEYHDYFIKKYYQFQDFDFNNTDVKILIQYLTQRSPYSPITTTSAMDFSNFLDLTNA